jgi:hypothetical protein
MPRLSSGQSLFQAAQNQLCRTQSGRGS